MTSEALEARRLVELRDRWLNRPEWVKWVDEPVPSYPKRPVPRSDNAARALKKRTLTNLYNARPQWLADAHGTLDAAVAAAYGWPADMEEDAALRELLALSGGSLRIGLGSQGSSALRTGVPSPSGVTYCRLDAVQPPYSDRCGSR